MLRLRKRISPAKYREFLFFLEAKILEAVPPRKIYKPSWNEENWTGRIGSIWRSFRPTNPPPLVSGGAEAENADDASLPFTAFLRHDEENRDRVSAPLFRPPPAAIPRNTVLWPCSPLSRNFVAYSIGKRRRGRWRDSIIRGRTLMRASDRDT